MGDFIGDLKLEDKDIPFPRRQFHRYIINLAAQAKTESMEYSHESELFKHGEAFLSGIFPSPDPVLTHQMLLRLREDIEPLREESQYDSKARADFLKVIYKTHMRENSTIRSSMSMQVRYLAAQKTAAQIFIDDTPGLQRELIDFAKSSSTARGR